MSDRVHAGVHAPGSHRGVHGLGPQQEAHRELEREVKEARGRSGSDELLIGVAIQPEARRSRQPERRLVLAMLREALLDAVVGTGGACRHEAQEAALGWIAGDVGVYGRRGWTFEYCCELAGVDADWLRERLRTQLRAGVTEISIMRIAAVSSEVRQVERRASPTRRATWTPERRAAAAVVQTAVEAEKRLRRAARLA